MPSSAKEMMISSVLSEEFWVDGKGAHPEPFTLIKKEDVESGKWVPDESRQVSHTELSQRVLSCIETMKAEKE